jgi:hypothetical protein
MAGGASGLEGSCTSTWIICRVAARLPRYMKRIVYSNTIMGLWTRLEASLEAASSD